MGLINITGSGEFSSAVWGDIPHTVFFMEDCGRKSVVSDKVKALLKKKKLVMRPEDSEAIVLVAFSLSVFKEVRSYVETYPNKPIYICGEATEVAAINITGFVYFVTDLDKEAE